MRYNIIDDVDNKEFYKQLLDVHMRNYIYFINIGRFKSQVELTNNLILYKKILI